MTNRRSTIALTFLLATIPCGSNAETAAPNALPPEIVRTTLKNGLDVWIWPDSSIPNAALYLWFRVGSRNEGPGRTGLSHFFEHMMFNGAKKYGPGMFDRTLEDAGGSNNAFTSTDVTTYQDWFPASALPLVLELEADRIGHLRLEPAMVASERGVVASERRTSVDDNPHARLDEQLRAMSFLAHPYGIPTIGWPSDIESWTQTQLEAHFKTYYAPNNCTLVLVGDITPGQALALIQKTLGRLPRGPAIPQVTTQEPPIAGQRRLELPAHEGVGVVSIAFPAPAPTDGSFAAWELLETLLADGEASRLWSRLVERDRLAASVSVNIDEGFDPGLLTISATLAHGVSPEAVEAVIWEELAQLANSGPSQGELDKARRQQRTSLYRLLSTINGRAYALGHFLLFRGGAQALFEVEAMWGAVEPEQVKGAAAKLTPHCATVAIMRPVWEPADGSASPGEGAP